MLNSITTNTISINGKRILLQSSLNVPIQENNIQDDIRLQKSLPTIEFLRTHGGRIIIISHLSGDTNLSLRPIYEYFKKYMSIQFVEDLFSQEAGTLFSHMQDGDIVLCENIRRYAGEEKNDKQFAERLAQLADLYVQDDFTELHREYASIVTLPTLLPSFPGLQCEQEIQHLSQAFQAPRPSLAIIGGAKPETKLPLIQKLSENMDSIYVGGISANILLQAKGYDVGKSVTSDKSIHVEAILENPKIILPHDVLVKTHDGECLIKGINEVQSEDTIVDAGPETIRQISQKITESAFVLWNGPLGDYEKGFYDATITVARALSDAKTYSVVGGGDTVTALAKQGLTDTFTFLSTAGGAMLEFLSEGTLPGIEALKKSPELL